MGFPIKDPKTGKDTQLNLKKLISVKVPLISLDGSPETGIFHTRLILLLLISTPFFFLFAFLMAIKIIPRSWAPEAVEVVTKLTNYIAIAAWVAIIIGILYILSFLFKPLPHAYWESHF